jgi:signal transduction histidine kinase
MKRLWVRLSIMITGVLFCIFFLQFVDIMYSRSTDDPANPPNEAVIVARLLRFAGLSLLVGVAGGIAVGRVVSSPVTALSRAARQIGCGELDVRVLEKGSQEIRELAATFNRMATALQQAETARNNLMADVSHELRTPLTVLEGNLRAALDHVQALDESSIANLYTQTRHLIRLVNDLRELSLAENGQLNLEKIPTDIRSLVSETLQVLEPLANEKKVQMIIEIRDLPLLDVDPVRIRQGLFNLLSNALRHTSPGDVIRISSEQKQSSLMLKVEDSGEGLASDDLASIFNRFYRVDKSRSRETGGTGLGLSITKAIIEAHGGTITADSAGRGTGSCFTITFSDNVILSSQAINSAMH